MTNYLYHLSKQIIIIINMKPDARILGLNMEMEAKLCLLFFLLHISYCLCEDRLGQTCSNDKSFSSNTPTSTNVDRVLQQLVAGAAASQSFATASHGYGEEKVYGLIQCREDVSSKDCSACAADAAKQLHQLCENKVDARIWFDFCFLRYEVQQDFIGKLDTGFGILYGNVENVTNPELFEQKLGALMDDARTQAVKPESRGLGKGDVKLSPLVTLYGLVQCTRDLPQLSCAQCIATAITNFENFCKYRKGCRVLYSSCYVRYEIYPFFFPLDISEADPGVAASSQTVVYIKAGRL